MSGIYDRKFNEIIRKSAKKPLSGDDVNEAAEKSAPYFEELVKRSVSAIGEII